MTPQQITEAQRLASLLDESRVSVMRMHAHEAAALLRTLAAQAAQERPAVDVDALMALAEKMMRDSWRGVGELSWRPAADELRAALEGLK